MKQKTGILLVNLGTPDSADYFSIQRYLKEFLSDKRVVELSPWLWKPILYAFILPFRPFKLVKAYKKIWLSEMQDSPLRYFTSQQAKKLFEKLQQNKEEGKEEIRFNAAQAAQNSSEIEVEYGMRYGAPSIASAFEKLEKKNCKRILFFPLYPQYAAPTSATACDQFFRILMQKRFQPAIRFVEPYYQHSAYIDALLSSTEKHLMTLKWRPQKILVSFHGIPQAYAAKGDPYPEQCQVTFERMVEAFKEKNMPPLEMSFQSRFGPKKWLQPYTDQKIEHLAKEGVEKLAIIAPAFASDCIETLEELAIGGKEIFTKAGGKNFSLIPSLNDSEISIGLLEQLAREAGAGWF